MEWDAWLASSNTQIMLKTLKETLEELRDLITDGSHLQEKKTDRIALDYTYSMGQLDGMRTLIEMIKDIASIVETNDDDRNS